MEVEDEDENVTQEAFELEVEAGQVVVKEQVNEVEAEVTTTTTTTTAVLLVTRRVRPVATVPTDR